MPIIAGVDARVTHDAVLVTCVTLVTVDNEVWRCAEIRWHRDTRDTCDGWTRARVWALLHCPQPGVMGIYLHPPRNNDLGIHGDDDSSLNGTMTLSIKNIPRRGREFSVWAYFQDIVSKRWEHFHNLSQLSTVYTSLSLIVWLLVTEPSFSSVVALMGLSTCSGASSASVSAATQDSAICS